MYNSVNVERLGYKKPANAPDLTQQLFTSASGIRMASKHPMMTESAQSSFSNINQSNARQAVMAEPKMLQDGRMTFGTAVQVEKFSQAVRNASTNRFMNIRFGDKAAQQPNIHQTQQAPSALSAMKLSFKLSSVLNQFKKIPKIGKEAKEAEADKGDITVEVKRQSSFEIKDDHLTTCFSPNLDTKAAQIPKSMLHRAIAGGLRARVTKMCIESEKKEDKNKPQNLTLGFSFNSRNIPFTENHISQGYVQQLSEQKEKQVSMPTNETVKNWAQDFSENFYDNTIKASIFENEDANKDKVLENLYEHVKECLLLVDSSQLATNEYNLVYIHYNGPGKVSDDPLEAGHMLCENDEAITAVELVQKVLDAYVDRHGIDAPKALRIDLFLDCCGAAGQYHVLIDALKKGQIRNYEYLKKLAFAVPCNYDEVSFCTQSGGKFTKEIIDSEGSNWNYDRTKVSDYQREFKIFRNTQVKLCIPSFRINRMLALKKSDEEKLYADGKTVTDWFNSQKDMDIAKKLNIIDEDTVKWWIKEDTVK